jgi:hypothetical protein
MSFDPTKPACQRNGRGAVILTVLPDGKNSPHDEFVISAWIEGHEGEGWMLETYRRSGRYSARNISGLDLINDYIPDVNPVLALNDLELGLRKSFPVLALLARIEALAAGRIMTNVDPMSNMTSIKELALEAMKHVANVDANPVFKPTRADLPPYKLMQAAE